MKHLAFLILFVQTAQAYDIKILNWYRLDRSNNIDTAAEVCFRLKPAPRKLVPVNITVDKNRRSEAYYVAWVGPKGSACHVVSTQRGLVEVEAPKAEVKDSQEGFIINK